MDAVKYLPWKMRLNSQFRISPKSVNKLVSLCPQMNSLWRHDSWFTTSTNLLPPLVFFFTHPCIKRLCQNKLVLKYFNPHNFSFARFRYSTPQRKIILVGKLSTKHNSCLEFWRGRGMRNYLELLTGENLYFKCFLLFCQKTMKFFSSMALHGMAFPLGTNYVQKMCQRSFSGPL